MSQFQSYHHQCELIRKPWVSARPWSVWIFGNPLQVMKEHEMIFALLDLWQKRRGGSWFLLFAAYSFKTTQVAAKQSDEKVRHSARTKETPPAVLLQLWHADRYQVEPGMCTHPHPTPCQQNNLHLQSPLGGYQAFFPRLPLFSWTLPGSSGKVSRMAVKRAQVDTYNRGN